MKAKRLLLAFFTVLALVCGIALAACKQPDNPPVEPTPTEYTVTFDANGGALSGNATVKVKEGNTITGAPTASKENHDFDGWFTQATGGEEITLATYTVSADVTLYAQYTEKQTPPPPPPAKVEVTFDANGGTLQGETKYEVDENGNILELPEATREGYRFDAWYSAATDGDLVDPMFDTITESVTLYAHWIKTYTVTFNAGEGTLAGAETVTVDENGKIAGAPEATKSGDEFHGWYTQAEGGDKIDLETYTVSADVTLYAHFGVITMPVKTLKSHEGAKVGYRIEAEAAKAEGTQNSDNSTHPGEFLEDVANASGGQSLGYLGVVGNKVTFTFKSATAGKAKLSLVASSANIQMDFSAGFVMWGADQPLTGNEMNMAFNGNKVTYEKVTVKGATKEEAIANGGFAFNFRWTSVPVAEVEVVAGVNSFVITVQSDQTVNIDCLDIETTLDITSANGDAVSGEAILPAPPAPDTVYEGAVTVSLVIGAYDGGPAVQKAILNFGTQDITAENLASANFSVNLGGKLGGATDKTYLCDENGEQLAEGATSKYVAIEYTPTFNTYGIDGGYSVFNYNQQTGVNSWKDFSTVTLAMSGTLTIGETKYNKMGGNVSLGKKIIPSIDNIWDVTGSYTKKGAEGAKDITLKYASYGSEAMKNDNVKNALIIWLHGQGEGGTDPTIALLGNKVTALATDTVQKYFTAQGGEQGAYVLAPQAPTMWMDYDGNYSRVDAEHKDSYYGETLWELIQKFVTDNPDIDANRIYIGGCSNGGFMTMQMIEKHADYFAAAYPIATPYASTPELISAVKNLPIWFTHAKNDTTVSIADWQSDPNMWWAPATFVGYADTNTNAIYIDLLAAGATNVHYSLFENVNNGVDYMGHYSWIWIFNDQVKYVQATTGADGTFALGDLDEKSKATVTVGENTEASLWAWLAAQKKAA